MSALVDENWGTALLMSLLEESNGEEYNEEQLNKVIRSLEAEINEQNMLLEGDHDLIMDPELLLSDEEEEDGHQNCLASMDFDMVMEQLVDQCELDFDDLIQYEIVSGGFSDQIYNVVSETDHQEHGFSYLWHETCDGVLAYN